MCHRKQTLRFFTFVVLTVIPLLLVHGWPGTVWEFNKILPILTRPRNGIALEVVCPSLPGYGFSDAPQKPGLSLLFCCSISY